VRELVQAFIKVGDTAVEHRVDPALFNLVNMPAVWDKMQDELAKEGKKTAVRHYQNILQLHASFWADADTLPSIERSLITIKRLSILRKTLYDFNHQDIKLRWEMFINRVDDIYVIEYGIADRNDKLPLQLKIWDSHD
jgi:hypothetical protein